MLYGSGARICVKKKKRKIQGAGAYAMQFKDPHNEENEEIKGADAWAMHIKGPQRDGNEKRERTHMLYRPRTRSGWRRRNQRDRPQRLYRPRVRRRMRKKNKGSGCVQYASQIHDPAAERIRSK